MSMSAHKVLITVLRGALTHLDLSSVPATADTDWLVTEGHAMVLLILVYIRSSSIITMRNFYL